MIKFRCPHRPWKVPADKTRDEKAAARREEFVVPADAEWTRVDDEYSSDKKNHPRYAHEVGARWVAEVECPVCGDTIEVSTDQDPAQDSSWDRAKAEADANAEAERAAAALAQAQATSEA